MDLLQALAFAILVYAWRKQNIKRPFAFKLKCFGQLLHACYTSHMTNIYRITGVILNIKMISQRKFVFAGHVRWISGGRLLKQDLQGLVPETPIHGECGLMTLLTGWEAAWHASQGCEKTGKKITGPWLLCVVFIVHCDVTLWCLTLWEWIIKGSACIALHDS